MGAGVDTAPGAPSVGADDEEVSGRLKKVGAAVPAAGAGVLGLGASGSRRSKESEKGEGRKGWGGLENRTGVGYVMLICSI